MMPCAKGALRSCSSPANPEPEKLRSAALVLWGQAALAEGDFEPSNRSVYLFYGKAEFPTPD